MKNSKSGKVALKVIFFKISLFISLVFNAYLFLIFKKISSSSKSKINVFKNYSNTYFQRSNVNHHGLNSLSQEAQSPTLKNEPKVILCFPFHHEFEVLYIKLLLLSPFIDQFVLVESEYNERGEKKPLLFTQKENNAPFVTYRSEIKHIISTFVPNEKGKDLLWTMKYQMKNTIGEYIIQNVSHEYPFNSIVLVGDADEIPSPESITWLKTNVDFSSNTGSSMVYEYASTMPSFIYGFSWLTNANGYSTLTARSLKDEV